MDGHETQTRTLLATQTRNAAGTLPFLRARTTLSRVLLVVLLCAALPGGPVLHAQEAPLLTPGDRIRISSPTAQVKQTGRLISMDEETLVLELDRTGDTVRLVRAEWPYLERRERSADAGKDELKYGAIGFLVGGAMGMGLGYAIHEHAEPAPTDCFFGCTRLDVMKTFGMAFGLVGGLLGALSPHDRWVPITLPQGLSIHATPAEGVAVLVTIRR